MTDTEEFTAAITTALENVDSELARISGDDITDPVVDHLWGAVAHLRAAVGAMTFLQAVRSEGDTKGLTE